MVDITKCPPGTAQGATLHPWQFGVDPLGYANIGTARRLASEDFTVREQGVLEVVLAQSGHIPQRELERMLLAQIGASHSQVYSAAQRLAKHGKICRKKIGGQWHYARPGHHWLRPRQPNV